MFKKNLALIFILLTLFCYNIDIIYAYDYVNPDNESLVIEKINEIYDAKEQYEDLVGAYEEEPITIHNATSDEYWWPIGSSETTESKGKIYARGEPEETVITSTFGYRDDVVVNGVVVSAAGGHGALDIANYRGVGVTNIIASKSGIVVYPSSGDPISCPTGATNSNCGGGYGNYVIIQHSDGNYTLYAHLHPDTILVKAGESVEQGQVIGKMGSTGYSTGSHLHFEIRKGQNSSAARVDPLEYISQDNPRPATSGSKLLEFIEYYEGCTDVIGNDYLVIDIGDGVRTVGTGVTLEYNPGRFAQYGIDIDDYPVGSTIPISIVDQIKIDILNDNIAYVEAVAADNSISLEQHQIDALVSQKYNIGNIDGFATAYKQYGNTIEFYNNWFFRVIDKGGPFEAGLTNRRNAEWRLFHEGIYEH